MAVRKVKLQDTGEIVGKDTKGIYQAPNKKYYSSEDAYLAIDLENSCRESCINKMYDFMGYNKTMKLSTFFFKRLAEWHEGYSYSVINKAMQMSEDIVKYINTSKSFDSEVGKMNYIMAIVQNRLNDAQKMATHARQRVKQVSKEDNTDMLFGIESLQSLPVKRNKGTDVTSLVGDI